MIEVASKESGHPDKVLDLDPKIALPLFIKGEILSCDAGAVAVVGSRKPTLYGIKLAEKIAETAVKSGKTVISGLARGIDTEAHRAALKYGGRTIAVLGTGINVVYPEENIALAEEISQKGALISQFPPDTPPIGRNFPIRNEIVAKMCNTLVLVQAAVKSGSLITARLALEFGKKVFVCPGEIGDPLFEGSYNFLKKYKNNGNLKILFDLNALSEPENESARIFDFSERQTAALQTRTAVKNETLTDESEKKVYNLIKSKAEGIDFDAISLLSEISPAELPATLLSLILKGMIKELSGKIYKLSEEKL